MNTIRKLAVDYEAGFQFERRIGITGEWAEILLCYLFDMKLVVNGINAGYDAIDTQNKQIQIKSVRKKVLKETSTKTGRLSRFSTHEFDLCYLVIFNKRFEPEEIWKATYNDLLPLLDKQERRNPSVSAFTDVAQRIEIPEDKKAMLDALFR